MGRTDASRIAPITELTLLEEKRVNEQSMSTDLEGQDQCVSSKSYKKLALHRPGPFD
jgi:hypothetical protein